MTFDLNKNYSGDEKKMMEDISSIMRILAKNGYTMEFKYDDCGIYILEFDHSNVQIADKVLVWLNEEEYENYTLGYLDNCNNNQTIERSW